MIPSSWCLVALAVYGACDLGRRFYGWLEKL